jgi:pyridoxine kinase
LHYTYYGLNNLSLEDYANLLPFVSFIHSFIHSLDVGNKAAVFPLQLLGLEVDVINSVQFSNHTGYTKGWKGTVMDGTQLQSILEGLEQNELLDDVGYVLTGYIGSASFLSVIRSLVLKIRGDKPDFRYLCDPVLGDDGELYVPAELVSLFKTEIIPLADIVTPNQFEVEQLTGITIQGIADAKRACSCFHDMGPSIVFLTSLELPAEEARKRKRVGDDIELITVFASQRHQKSGKPVDECFVIDCPKIPGRYTGTGDLTAAYVLLLMHSIAWHSVFCC